jgi:hypothetical protein
VRLAVQALAVAALAGLPPLLNASTLATLHDFGGSDGANPAAEVIQDPRPRTESRAQDILSIGVALGRSADGYRTSAGRKHRLAKPADFVCTQEDRLYCHYAI